MRVCPVKVLLIEREEAPDIVVQNLLLESHRDTFALTQISAAEEALAALLQQAYDVCLIDSSLGQQAGLAFLREARQRGVSVPLIFLDEKGDHVLDEEVMQAGAAEIGRAHV